MSMGIIKATSKAKVKKETVLVRNKISWEMEEVDKDEVEVYYIVDENTISKTPVAEHRYTSALEIELTVAHFQFIFKDCDDEEWMKIVFQIMLPRGMVPLVPYTEFKKPVPKKPVSYHAKPLTAD
jgi:hypothetical protein